MGIWLDCCTISFFFFLFGPSISELLIRISKKGFIFPLSGRKEGGVLGGTSHAKIVMDSGEVWGFCFDGKWEEMDWFRRRMARYFPLLCIPFDIYLQVGLYEDILWKLHLTMILSIFDGWTWIIVNYGCIEELSFLTRSYTGVAKARVVGRKILFWSRNRIRGK
jgi:hypothetical protein